MTFTLAPGFQVPVTVSPVLADGVTPSLAKLSNIAFNTAGPFIVGPDPTTAGGGLVTCPAGTTPGATDTLNYTATATEPDGVTTEQISGSTSLIAGTPVPPPPGVAASLVAKFGTPVPIPAK